MANGDGRAGYNDPYNLPGYQIPGRNYYPHGGFGGFAGHGAAFGDQPNLRELLHGWEAASRFAVPLTQQFGQDMAGVGKYFRREMGRNYGRELFEQGRTQVEQGMQEGARASRQALTRAGYGGQASSPFESSLQQMRTMAGMGQLGPLAQQATLYNRQLQEGAARGYQNWLSARLQGLLIPAHLQSARHANVQAPPGPSLLQAGVGALGSFLGAFA